MCLTFLITVGKKQSKFKRCVQVLPVSVRLILSNVNWASSRVHVTCQKAVMRAEDGLVPAINCAFVGRREDGELEIALTEGGGGL